MNGRKKKPCYKSIEVVWRREDGPKIRRLYDLPRMREIDLEGSAVKKPAKSVIPSRATKKYVTRVHKRVRRSLFQGDEKTELEKYIDVPELKKKPRELLPPNGPPAIVLNREITRATVQRTSACESNTLQTETESKTVDFLPSRRGDVRDALVNRPSIVGEYQINPRGSGVFRSDFSDMMSNQKPIDVKSNDLGKVPDHDDINKNKLAVNHREFGNNVTTSPSCKRRGSSNLSETLASRLKSPIIVSNRYKTHLNALSDKLNQRPFDVQSKCIKSLSSVRKTSNVESTNEDEKRIIPPRILNVRRSSPEIVSNRKRSLDKTNGSKHNRINAQATRTPDENLDKPRDPGSGKRSDSCLPKAPQNISSRPESPPISLTKKKMKISSDSLFCEHLLLFASHNAENLKTIELPQSSVRDTPVIKSSSYTAQNRMIPRESNSAGYAKSPEIVSNRKRNNENSSLNFKREFDRDVSNVAATITRDENHREPCDPISCFRKMSDSCLPEAASQTSSSSESSPITLNKNKMEISPDSSFCEPMLLTSHNAENPKTIELPQSSVRDTPVIKSSSYTAQSRTSSRESNSAGYAKSPEIVLNRKRNNENSSLLNFKQEFDCDVSNAAETVTRDENQRETCDPVSCFKKMSDSYLPEAAPQTSSRPQSPPITLNKKKMEISPNSSFCEPVMLVSHNAENPKTVVSPQSSVSDTPPIKISLDTTRNRMVPRKSNSGHAKSPLIMSNRKRFYVDDSLDITDELDRSKLNVAVNTASNENRLKPCDAVPCSRQMTDGLSETSKISSRPKSPPIVTNRKKIKIGLEASFCESNTPIRTEKLLGSSIIKPSNITRNEQNPRAGALRLFRSPEIMSNRKRKSTEISGSNYGKLDNKLKVTATVESTKNDRNRNAISLKNRCNSLFEIPQTSFGPGPLQIISNRKKTKMEDNTNWIPVSKLRLFRNSENVGANKPLLLPRSVSDSSKTALVSSSNTAQNQIKPCIDYEPCKRKSPEIKSNRKLHVGHNNLSKKNVSEFDRSNTGAYGISKNDHQIDDRVVSPKKITNGLFEVSQEFTYLKIPQIIPNRERISTAENTCIPISKRRLFQTVKIAETAKTLLSDTAKVPSVKPPNFVRNEIKPSTDRDVFKSKFSKAEYDKRIINKFRVVAQTSVNRKSESILNIRLVDFPLKSKSSELSEDIIESSEIICMNKQILEKNKTRRHKKSKTKQLIHKKQTDELMSVVDGPPEIVLQENEFKNKAELVETNRNELCVELMSFDCADIIHTENVVKSPFYEQKIKNLNKKIKKSLTELQNNNHHLSPTEAKLNDVQKCSVLPILSDAKENEDDLTPLKQLIEEGYLNKAKNNKMVTFALPSPEISVVPATPEKDAVNVDKVVIENFSETYSNLSVPLIEVDQSPKTSQEKNQFMALIQSDHSPKNEDSESLSGLFESVTSPTPCPSNTDVNLLFKIDSAVSPASAVYEVNLFSPEPCRKKMSNNSPSPSHFDSAKKRKKVCKDGLRGKFRELINRKKSEACIREYEKTLSKDYQQKPDGESVMLNVMEVWKENSTFVLLCYQTKVQNVLIPLDNCPKNVIKNSIIRIYFPWTTVESKIMGLLMYVGVVHVEVIECPGLTRPLGPPESLTNFNGLPTSLYQSEVLWKCKCSKDTTCQCLGDLSAYNYLQYMVSY